LPGSASSPKARGVAAKEFEEAKTNARLYREEGPGGVTIKTIS
jgi:hypothetical protein